MFRFSSRSRTSMLALAAFLSACVAREDSRPAASATLSSPRPQQPRRVSALEVRKRAPYHVGWKQLKLPDGPEGRKLWVDLWYPAAPSAQERAKTYLLTRGSVATDAPLAPGLPSHLPLVLLSHGSSGSAQDYPWLSETLAAYGMLVAGIHHFGESRIYGIGSIDPNAPLRFWLRPPDVRRAYESLRADPVWGTRLDGRMVFGVGHSAGAHTVLAAAGAAYQLAPLGKYCASTSPHVDRGCSYASEHSVAPPSPDEIAASVGGVPFAALVLLDPALGPSFLSSSLQALRIPVHIFATSPGDFLPIGPHAERLAELLPNAELTRLRGGAGHFVYLGECSLGISVQGVPLCSDAPGVDRGAIHESVAAQILRFLSAVQETSAQSGNADEGAGSMEIPASQAE